MAEAPYWPVATDAFVADTMHLNAEETGAYIMLLMCLWRSSDATLPLDHVTLCRMARVQSKRWPKVWETVGAFFKIEGGRISQKRLLEDRSRVSNRIASARANGKRGGHPKSLINNDQGEAGGSNPVNPNPTGTEPDEKLTITITKKEAVSSNATLPGGPIAAADLKAEGEVEDWVRIGTWAIHTAGLANAPRPVTFTVVKDWLANGWTETQIKAGISAVTARPSYQPPRSLKFFEEAIREANPASADPLTYARSFVADFNEERWRRALYDYAIGKPWPYGLYGPPINQPGTLVWPFLIEVYRTKFGSLEPGVLVAESEVA